MTVDENMVDHLAGLSRLKFTADQKLTMQKDMEQIIAFVEKLGRLDTTGVEPLRHMTREVNIFRRDAVAGSISHEAALQNAVSHDDSFFKVPKVINRK